MAKKNQIIIKTFEEFKSDNENYYNIVLKQLNDILIILTNTIKPNFDKNKSVKQINDIYQIESNIDFYDLYHNEESNNINDIIYIVNNKTKENIDIEFTAYISDSKIETGGEVDEILINNTISIDIENITYINEEMVNVIFIKITPEIEKIIIQIINKLKI